jgi:hypothetical protein
VHGGAPVAPPCTQAVLRAVRVGLNRLPPGGRLVLCTGAAIVGGEDTLRPVLEPELLGAGAATEYSVLEADIAPDEMARPEYVDVEQIAAVGLVATVA